MPDKDVDFALYNINGVSLLPGLDVFSNPFHCNAHSIANALEYVCEQTVHSSEQLTEVLIVTVLSIIHTGSSQPYTAAAIAYHLRIPQSMYSL